MKKISILLYTILISLSINAQAWMELEGLNALSANAFIYSICTDKEDNIYAAGTFENNAGLEYVAKWNGNIWSKVGGLNGLNANNIINTLCTDSSGNIYAAGNFTNSSGNRYVAKYDPNALPLQHCSYTATLSNQYGTCTGNTVLMLAATDSISQIIWYNNTTPIDTIIATTALDSGITVAGGNGAGDAANQLHGATGEYVDSRGNLYIADAQNNRVQKFPSGSTSSTNGVTVAGGNGAGAAANQFYIPSSVYVDRNDNLYVCDAQNHRIQKFPPNSTSITNGETVAGGNGAGNAANQLNTPIAVFVDDNDNIYIADVHNNRVQRWAKGAINGITVAGGNGQGSAANQLNQPNVVFVDNVGNLYVSDPGNNQVQKFPPGSTSSTNGVTVAGGNGIGSAPNQLIGPDGIYVDNKENLYVADVGNNRIQKFLPDSTNGITVAGGNGAGSAANQFNVAIGIYLDNSNNLYIGDNYNNRIQKWVLGGIDTTYKPIAAGTYSAVVTNKSGCTDTTNSIVVNATVIPSISIHAAADTICAGTSVTFTATPTNGGTAPTYQWTKNSIPVNGATVFTYTSDSLHNNDTIRCVLTSNTACATPTTTISDSIVMSVNTNSTPTLSIAITAGSQTICAGSDVTFTATATNGGTTPTYQWTKNSKTISGATASTYTTDSLLNNDTIRCVLTSNATCVTPSTAISDSVIMSVTTKSTPSVSIAVTTGLQTITANTLVTFTATPVNGGSLPNYLFMVNGNTVQNGTAATYSTDSLHNNDIVSCSITSNAACITTNTDTSNTITMTVITLPQCPSITPPTNIDTAICSNNQYQLPSGILVNNPGIYYDTVKSISDCDSLINIINLTMYPVSSINITDSFYQGQSYTLPSGRIVTDGGIYQSILNNVAGCDSVINTTLIIRTGSDCVINPPQFFTPNGDGQNDVWKAIAGDCIKQAKLSVYNRWGGLVYHSDNYMNDWNGKYNNTPLPDATYYYVIEAIYYNGHNQTAEGNVTIIR